jgi:hypothetical protein
MILELRTYLEPSHSSMGSKYIRQMRFQPDIGTFVCFVAYCWCSGAHMSRVVHSNNHVWNVFYTIKQNNINERYIWCWPVSSVPETQKQTPERPFTTVKYDEIWRPGVQFGQISRNISRTPIRGKVWEGVGGSHRILKSPNIEVHPHDTTWIKYKDTHYRL